MSDNVLTTDAIKDMVRTRYGDIAARADSSCCAPAAPSCCETAAAPDLNTKARDIGYSEAPCAMARARRCCRASLDMGVVSHPCKWRSATPAIAFMPSGLLLRQAM